MLHFNFADSTVAFVWTGSRVRQCLILALVALCISVAIGNSLNAQVNESSTEQMKRPNVVWIMSEDNSKHYLKLFDENGVETPNIRAMAEHGVTFRRAFSNAPVCSVARTTLITGAYAPRLGAQHHRKIKVAKLPEGWKLFPALLRDAGYYTTNNSKKDYNVEEGKGVWDASSRDAHWKDRKAEQPFFHVQTFTDSHESSLHFSEAWAREPKLTTNPQDVAIADYHPDTELFRLTYARYHDRIQSIDAKVGQVIAELKEAGELENTIVFYFGDHGGVLPRGKGFVYEAGLHVPLVVRIPDRWQSLVPYQKGGQANGFVEFVDFAPTVLRLAGVDVPDFMDGQPFLGANVDASTIEQRKETVGYADRMDEKYDHCRSLRIGNWKYIRNYQAIYPDGLQNNYRYEMLAYRQWREKFKANQLNSVQSQFFRSKPAEQLFDLDQDPHEVNDLSGVPEHAERLESMRARLRKRLLGMRDLSFFPEHYLVDQATQPLVEFGEANEDRVALYLKIADFALEQPDVAMGSLRQAMISKDPLARSWAFSTASIWAIKNPKLVRELAPLAALAMKSDNHPYVRLKAAEFAGIAGIADPMPTLRAIVADSDSSTLNLSVLQTLVFFRDGPFQFDTQFDTATITANNDETLRRIGYLDGLNAKQMQERIRQHRQKTRGRNRQNRQRKPQRDASIKNEDA